MQHVFLRQILTNINWISDCHNFHGPLEKKLPRLHSNIIFVDQWIYMKSEFEATLEMFYAIYEIQVLRNYA